MSIEFTCSCGKHYKFVKHYKVMVVSDGATSDARIEQLVAELIADDDEMDLAEQELVESSVAQAAPAKSRVGGAQARSAPAKSALVPPAAPERNDLHEKVPAPQPRPRKTGDEAAAPRVAFKYWIVLAVCVLTLAATWFWSRTGKTDPGSLAELALSGPSLEERINATVALTSFTDDAGLTQLRRVAAKSNDAQVSAAALRQLTARLDRESVPLFLDALESPDKAVREVGFNGLTKLLIRPEEMGYRLEDTAEMHVEALSRLRTYYKQTKAKPGD